jgi:NHS family xanthosine MFS transporter
MSIKLRLILLNFMQYFIWGCWLITIGTYCSVTKNWSFSQFGAIFSTMGFSSLFMPAIAGILVDRVINAEKLFGIFHILGGIALCFVPLINTPVAFFWMMLIVVIFYMPTISLSITVAYSILKTNDIDVVKEFPPIRTWGTVGFIAALWTVSLTHNETTSNQFYIAGAVGVLLGLYAFTLPGCPPLSRKVSGKSFVEAFGLKAFTLFRTPRFAVFFIFSMLLGAALQLTNAYGTSFLHGFTQPEYRGLFAVKYPGVLISISQVSETLFILAIPFFLKRFGIKSVMIFSMVAWVLRFGLFAFGDPAGGLWMLVLSCIVYGMAFDFFNISGSLFVESQTSPEIRGSAQGVFMMMVNGIGACLGSIISGLVIDKFFVSPDHVNNWHGIWLSFAAYALVIAVIFPFVFRYKHNAALKHAIAKV